MTTLCYCQSILDVNCLLVKMVEYVGKRLLLLGLLIYIRFNTLHGTVKDLGQLCLNPTIISV